MKANADIILYNGNIHTQDDGYPMARAVANVLGLKLANIGLGTPDPTDGVIARDASGHPTGVLKELAPNLIRNVLSRHSRRETILENRQKAVCDAHGFGLTSIHDSRLMGGLEGADALKAWVQELADLIVLDQDIFKIDPDNIPDARVDLTLFDGKIVYER